MISAGFLFLYMHSGKAKQFLPLGVRSAFLIFLLLCFKSGYAHAAAWTLETGATTLITSLTYYGSREFSDRNGDRKRQPYFSKWEVNPLLEYGIRPDMTLGVSPRMQYAEQNQQGERENVIALSDIDVFLRKRLYQNKEWVIALQPLIKLPGTYNSNAPLIGRKTTDLELRTLFGYSFSLKDRYHFSNVELAYRKRINGVSDEMRADATLGIRFSEKWLLLLQNFNTLAVNGALGSNISSEASSGGFDLSKIQTSMVYTFSSKLSGQIGVIKDIWGRNTGIGKGMVAAIWISF